MNKNTLAPDLLRLINACVAGPGHGGPAIAGNVCLEGTWIEVYPDVTQDEAGLKKLFKQFSFSGGISSHVAPTTPGSIHEEGELGSSLSHAFGAMFDNPILIASLRGLGWTPYFVEGDEPEKMHELMAATLDTAIEDIRQAQKNARDKNEIVQPRWKVGERPKNHYK